MSTVTTVPTPSPLQEELSGVEQVAIAAAAPFVKSAGGQAKVQAITSEVNLGIASLPLLASLFQNIANLIHHAHKTVVNSQPAQTGSATE